MATLTHAEILALSGRDLDRAVAVVRRDYTGICYLHPDGIYRDDPCAISSDIAAAMRLLGEIPYGFCIDAIWDGERLQYHIEAYSCENEPISGEGVATCNLPTLADLPAAICRVYLMLRSE